MAWLVPPVPYAEILNYEALCERPQSPPCIVLSSPRTTPALFEIEHRYDRGHLNDRGAVAMAQAIAQQLQTLSTSGRLPLRH